MNISRSRALRERRIAWNVLRDSTTMRMVANMAAGHDSLDRACARHRAPSARLLESDRDYFSRRSGEQRNAAGKAASARARRAHDELAELYANLSEAAPERQVRNAREQRHEALLDAALKETFPASDPVSTIHVD